MLQHNVQDGPRSGRRAHIAHGAVMGLHAICCGMPALAMLAAAVSGTTSGIALLSGSVEKFHDFMHMHEVWILVVSALLVAVGGAMEITARRDRANAGIPWLFAFSALCFLINLGLILAHRA